MDQVHWLDFEEPSEGGERDGWILHVVGWMLIVLACVPAILIGDSQRDGSNLWLWFGLVLGGSGLFLLAISRALRMFHEDAPLPRLERWILSEETTP